MNIKVAKIEPDEFAVRDFSRVSAARAVVMSAGKRLNDLKLAVQNIGLPGVDFSGEDAILQEAINDLATDPALAACRAQGVGASGVVTPVIAQLLVDSKPSAINRYFTGIRDSKEDVFSFQEVDKKSDLPAVVVEGKGTDDEWIQTTRVVTASEADLLIKTVGCLENALVVARSGYPINLLDLFKWVEPEEGCVPDPYGSPCGVTMPSWPSYFWGSGCPYCDGYHYRGHQQGKIGCSGFGIECCGWDTESGFDKTPCDYYYSTSQNHTYSYKNCIHCSPPGGDNYGSGNRRRKWYWATESC